MAAIQHISSWWNRSTVNIGASYWTAAESNYWKGKRDLLQIPANEAQLAKIAAPIASVFQFTPEAIKAIATSKAQREYAKEVLFEEVRAAEFPDRPSRVGCMFGFDLAVPPKEFAARWGYSQSHMLLRIAPVDGESSVVCADMRLLNVPFGTSVDDQREMARRYWRGAEPSVPATEVETLFQGKYVLEALLDW